MSFDIFVHRWRNREIASFARADFDLRFGPHIVLKDKNFVRVAYSDGEADIYVDDEETITGLMVNHFGGESFCDDLVAFIASTGGVIFWCSDTPSLVVADADVIEHLDEDMIKDFGPAAVIESGRDLIAAIEAS